MKDDFIYISHILDAINDIKEFAKDMNKKQFLGNKMAGCLSGHPCIGRKTKSNP